MEHLRCKCCQKPTERQRQSIAPRIDRTLFCGIDVVQRPVIPQYVFSFRNGRVKTIKNRIPHDVVERATFVLAAAKWPEFLSSSRWPWSLHCPRSAGDVKNAA